jgi:hypothetical protein
MRLLGLLLISALAFAQTGLRTRTSTGLDSIDASRLKADLTFLSSDALEGRRSLERGSEVAIQWIASQFAKAGLKPLVGDSYLQPVPLIEFTADREGSSLSVQHAGKTATYQAPEATVNFANETTISGSVVFAGYGITAPELGYDDYAGIDAKGKVVLIFTHEPQEMDESSVFNGRGNTRYTNATYKTLNAQLHGAIAILSTADPNNHPQGQGRGGRGNGQLAATRPRIPSEALVDGGAAIPVFTISARVAESLFEAAGKNPAAVESAIDARPSPSSFAIPDTRVQLHPMVTERRRANSYNVAGLIEGSDPALKNETVIFSGHFDHDGIGPLGILHGADDMAPAPSA